MSSSSEAEFDDDVPISKLSKTKSNSNGAAKPDSVKSSSSSRSSRTSRASAPRNYAEDQDMDVDGDEDDFQPKKKKKSAAKKTTAKPAKRKVKAEPEDEDDFQPKKKKKTTNGNGRKAAVKKETKAVKKTPKAAGKKEPVTKKLKKLEKADRIAHAMQSFLWWDAPSPPEGCQWSTMEHAGVSFTEPYEPHGFKLKYDGEDVNLNPVEEEAWVVIVKRNSLDIIIAEVHV